MLRSFNRFVSARYSAITASLSSGLFLRWEINQQNYIRLNLHFNQSIIFFIGASINPLSVPSSRITLNPLYNFRILRGITNMATSDVHESQLINGLMYTRFQYFTDSKHLPRSGSKHLLQIDSTCYQNDNKMVICSQKW